jgi:hypothetical protein
MIITRTKPKRMTMSKILFNPTDRFAPAKIGVIWGREIYPLDFLLIKITQLQPKSGLP